MMKTEMTMSDIADAAARLEAIDPARSFIVQAPAGSGKTELLIQRCLKLLSRVAAPEEIIAITFTRKAAAEMRGRIIFALGRARIDDPPETAHERLTWELARDVLAADARFGWQLPENPSRLRIQTIDALCAALTRQMPLVSELGAVPAISQDPDELYRQAARDTIADMESDVSWAGAVADLAGHLDNHLENTARLIAEMLARRDQWLRHVAEASAPALRPADHARQRNALEGALASLIHEAITRICDRFPASVIDGLLHLARCAAFHLEEAGMESPIRACGDLAGLPRVMPGADGLAAALDQWRGIRTLLLTGDGAWRKTVTKKLGFPAPSAVRGDDDLKRQCRENKDRFMALVSGLSGCGELDQALAEVDMLPDPTYGDAQWKIMQALFTVLKAAAGRLQLVFAASGEADFAEIAIRAARALGDSESPTDLALSLDYRIRHILVDEFQDTSVTQFDLLEKLTAGWTPGDGRTFFAVGDPMQSIYGFRQAEVGLFLAARRRGLGQVLLTPLTLSVNFRSEKAVIDWVNAAFDRIMPVMEDETTGAVSYTPSAAVRPDTAGSGVVVHPFLPSDSRDEAAALVRVIEETRRSDPNGRIAVLVRGRTHLAEVVPALKAAGLSFKAVEIDAMKNRPFIQDLTALCRALAHPADRIAWLAVLRAPWCGLTLADLHALAGGHAHQTVPDLMTDPVRVEALSFDGRQRLERVRAVLADFLHYRDRWPFSRLAEGAWVRLGGPALVHSEGDLDDARVFFDLLEQRVGPGVLEDPSFLAGAVEALFARPDSGADDTLQIMTIHKAKGLEFDTVIIPALEKRPPADPKRLLQWAERPAGGEKDLLLAPIPEAGSDADKIYKYIRDINERKRDLEDARVLYVAVTRAKKRLHLMAGAHLVSEGGRVGRLKPPPKKSLLNKLWPVVEAEFGDASAGRNMNPPLTMESETEPVVSADSVFQRDSGDAKTDGAIPDGAMSEARESVGPPVLVPFIRRFHLDFRLPDPPPDPVSTAATDRLPRERLLTDAPRFDWAGDLVRRSGIVIHQWLNIMGREGIDKWNIRRLHRSTPAIRRQLFRAGVGPEAADDAVLRVTAALEKTLEDPKGRWILGNHAEGACEYALTGLDGGAVVSVVIDRTFVDESGIRWIIDYKSGGHAGGSADEFFDREKIRYQERMAQYARLMAARDKRPIRLGLYFPRMTGWREWEY
jgi:ATP-dependent helicase/nuclease subunit A